MNETENMEEIKNFLACLKPVVALAEKEQAEHDQRDATGFSVFDYLKTKEVNLSRIFADLLNPTKPHGQGDLFLQLFLDELECRVKDWSERYRKSALEACEVACEHFTDKKGRIDIVLKFAKPTLWLGIENKPWALDSENQVGAYLEYLRKNKDPEAKICYFSGDGNDPDPTSIAKGNPDCLTVPYRKTGANPSIENWIERSLQACEAEPVRWFLKDLLGYIREEFRSEGAPSVARKEDIVGKTIVDFITDKPENVKLALDIEKAMDGFRKRIFTDFTAIIEEKLKVWIKERKGQGWMVSSTTKCPKEHMARNAAYVVLHKESWGKFDKATKEGKEEGDGWPAPGAAINTDAPNWEHVYFCVAAHTKYNKNLTQPFLDKLNKKLPKTLSGFTECGESSPAYKVLDGNLKNWNTKEFFSESMDTKQAEKMAEEIADQLCTLAETLDGMTEFENILASKGK